MTPKDLAFYLALPYTVTLTPLEEGGYFAQIDELYGCWSDGETPEKARENLREAMELWLEHRIEAGLPIAEPREIHE